MDSGVARKPIRDMDAYRRALRARLDPTAAGLELIFEKVRAKPKRVVFAEGEEEKTIRAALALCRQRLRHAGAGRPRGPDPRDDGGDRARARPRALEIHNARLSQRNKHYTEFLYARLQRHGMLLSRLPAAW